MTPHRKTVIALDFDRTFTSDIPFWRTFVLHALERGHTVYCVTARHDNETNRKQIEELFGPIVFPQLGGVIYTQHQSKRAVAQGLGVRIDIWIDDMPEGVGKQSKSDFQKHELQHKVYEELPVFQPAVVCPHEVWTPAR